MSAAIEFEHPPFLLEHDPELAKVHEPAMQQGLGRVALNNWLFSLTERPEETKQQKSEALNGHNGPFEVFTPQTPMIRPLRVKTLSATTALLTYSAAQLEYMYRVEAVETPEDTVNTTGPMVASVLSKLSNAYRASYELDGAGPEKLLLAHDLAQYAMRYTRDDWHGYHQSLGHWLHLNTAGQYTIRDEMYRVGEFEERLKLALALSELGEGPQGYAHCVVRDLVAIYKVQGKDEKAQTLKAHYANISTQNRDPLWDKAHPSS